jgi:hypothetical protein
MNMLRLLRETAKIEVAVVDGRAEKGVSEIRCCGKSRFADSQQLE